MGGDILVGDKTHYCNGSILVEWLVAITILLSLKMCIRDSGNAEQMVNHETGKPHTAHTTNVVPLILVGAQDIHKQLKSGKLCDIAPTMLALAHIDKPSNMTGESLLLRCV